MVDRPTGSIFRLDGLTKRQYYELDVDGEKLKVCLAKEKDMDDLAKFEQEEMGGIVKPYNAEEFRKIFHIGKIIILRDKSGTIVGYFALSFGSQSHDKLPVKDNEAYYSGVAFAKKYRGKGIFGKVEQLAEKVVREHRVVIKEEGKDPREEKIKRILAITRPTNIPAMKALERSGFTYMDASGLEKFMPPDESDQGIRVVFVKELDATEKLAGHMCEKLRSQLIKLFGPDVLRTFETEDGRFHIVIKNQDAKEPKATE